MLRGAYHDRSLSGRAFHVPVYVATHVSPAVAVPKNPPTRCSTTNVSGCPTRAPCTNSTAPTMVIPPRQRRWANCRPTSSKTAAMKPPWTNPRSFLCRRVGTICKRHDCSGPSTNSTGPTPNVCAKEHRPLSECFTFHLLLDEADAIFTRIRCFRNSP